MLPVSMPRVHAFCLLWIQIQLFYRFPKFTYSFFRHFSPSSYSFHCFFLFFFSFRLKNEKLIRSPNTNLKENGINFEMKEAYDCYYWHVLSSSHSLDFPLRSVAILHMNIWAAVAQWHVSSHHNKKKTRKKNKLKASQT